MAVSKRLRYEILRRDRYTCRYCGRKAPDVPLRVDHVIPQALGGADHPTNLVTSCHDCNAGKTSSMPDAMVVADVDQETFRQAAALNERRQVIFVHLCMVWAWAWEKTGRPITSLDEDQFTEETHKVLDRGMSAVADLTEAASRAGSHNAIDVAAYIGPIMRGAGKPLSTDDVRFIAGVDAVTAWETGWNFASDEGDPPRDAARSFIAELEAALDAGADPADLVKAATSAGESLSTDLRSRLTSTSTVGGGV